MIRWRISEKGLPPSSSPLELQLLLDGNNLHFQNDPTQEPISPLYLEIETDQGVSLPPSAPIIGRNAYLWEEEAITDMSVIRSGMVGLPTEATFAIHFAKLPRPRTRVLNPPRNVQLVQKSTRVEIDGIATTSISPADQPTISNDILFQLPRFHENNEPALPEDIWAVKLFRATNPSDASDGDLYSKHAQTVLIDELMLQRTVGTPLEEQVFTITDVVPNDSPYFYYLTVVGRQSPITAVSAPVATNEPPITTTAIASPVKSATPKPAQPSTESTFSDVARPPPVECFHLSIISRNPGTKKTSIMWEPAGENLNYNVYWFETAEELKQGNLSAASRIYSGDQSNTDHNHIGGYYYITGVMRYPKKDDLSQIHEVESAFVPISDENLHKATEHLPPRIVGGAPILPTEGTVRVVIIPIEFLEEIPDDPRTTGNGRFQRQHDRAWMQEIAQFLADYYHRSSLEKLTLEVEIGLEENLQIKETKIQFADRNAFLDLLDRVLVLASESVDFSKYDQIIILGPGAGPETGRPGDFPPHNALGPVAVLNCKPFTSRIYMNEYVSILGGTQSSKGQVAHEFGHSFNAMDLYDRGSTLPILQRQYMSFAANYGLMGISGPIMARGNHPADFSAWHKLRFGWYNSLQVITESGVSDQAQEVLIGGDDFVIVEIQPPLDALANETKTETYQRTRRGAEYLLIENMQRDLNIEMASNTPSGATLAILIWHIVEATDETHETQPTVIRLIEAHGGEMDLPKQNSLAGRFGNEEDLFYAPYKTEFSPSGDFDWIRIQNISEPGPEMSFTIGRISDIYMSPNGDDQANPGTKKRSLATLERALALGEQYREGEDRPITVHLLPGTYTAPEGKDWFARVDASDVIIRGDGESPGDVVIDGELTDSGIIVGASNVTIENLTIRRAVTDAVAFTQREHTNVVLRNIVVEDSGRHGIVLSGNTHLIEDSVIQNNGGSGIRLAEGGSYLTVKRTTISRNGDGIFIDNGKGLKQLLGWRNIDLSQVTIEENAVGIRARVFSGFFDNLFDTLVRAFDSTIQKQTAGNIEILVVDEEPKRALSGGNDTVATVDPALVNFRLIIEQSTVANAPFNVRNQDTNSVVSIKNTYLGTSKPDAIANSVIGPNIDISQPLPSPHTSMGAPSIKEIAVSAQFRGVDITFTPSTTLVGRSQPVGDTVRYRIYMYEGLPEQAPVDLVDVAGWYRVEARLRELETIEEALIRYTYEYTHKTPPSQLSFVVSAYVFGAPDSESAPSNMKTIDLTTPAQITNFVVNDGMEEISDLRSVPIMLDHVGAEEYCLQPQYVRLRCKHCRSPDGPAHAKWCEWLPLADLPSTADLSNLRTGQPFWLFAWVRDSSYRIGQRAFVKLTTLRNE